MPKGPLQMVVSIGQQHVTLYRNGVRVAQSPVSTGTPGHPTPTGVFSIIEKDRWHRSNLYQSAPMFYMQRLTWQGIALHGGDLPGYPASHGCIRLSRPIDFAYTVVGAIPGWSRERIDQVLASGQTTQAVLKQRIPVHIVYETAFFGVNGIEFRPDVYGRDRKLYDALFGRRPAS